MPFRFVRFLDHFFGKALLLLIAPLCSLIARCFLTEENDTPETITILKLHGGGSLLIALPALLGIRAQYPDAVFTLVGSSDTKKYAELTGIFNRYHLIDSTNPLTLLHSGLQALAASFRQDVFIDLEPHSFLAAVFCPLTFSKRRIGLVKAHEHDRIYAYTDALYFNLHAPVYAFYEQIAALLDATPAGFAAGQAALRAHQDASMPLLPSDQAYPTLYISAFASSLSPERMLPADLWIGRLRKRFPEAPFTVILGGGPKETDMARDLAALIQAALPAAQIINACGMRTLAQAAADIASVDEFWGIDSGPLHIARTLGKRCVSFWGPTNPAFLLKKAPEIDETLYYRALPCSPCVHVAAKPPCKGNNICIKLLFAPESVSPPLRL